MRLLSVPTIANHAQVLSEEGIRCPVAITIRTKQQQPSQPVRARG
jgi:hypothetical protein